MRSSFPSSTMSSRCRGQRGPSGRRRTPWILTLGVALVGATPVPAVGTVPPPAPEGSGRTAALNLPLESRTCLAATLLGGSVEVSVCLQPGKEYPWSASAVLDSVPFEELTVFLPHSAERIRGGHLTGRLDLEGGIPPGRPVARPTRCSGTLHADSLWWPSGESLVAEEAWVLVDTDLAVDLEIRSDTTGTHFRGLIEGLRGSVRYWSREFAMSGFRVSFFDSIGPMVSLTASTRICSNAGRSYWVHLQMLGPATRARPRLVSEPALSRPDIESLLALGIPLGAFSEEQLNLHSGPYWAQQVFLLRALEIAANRIIGLAQERAEELLGLDEVRVPTPAGAPGSTSEVEVAKRLGGRATVSYVSPVWHSSDYRVRLEVPLYRQISLESENDQTGDAGVDLRFKKRFR